MITSGKTCDFIVYGREDCHLCQQMITGLKQLQRKGSFDFEVIDIDTDPILVARFNDKIPVLMSLPDQTEICHHFLNLEALDDYLAKIR